MLPAVLIHAETLKRQVSPGPVVRLHRPGQEQRTLHVQVPHTVLHHRQTQRDHPSHLDGAAKADLPVPLGEVQIAHAELRPRYVHGEKRPGAAREVLDVAVAAVFGPAGNRARAFSADFLFQVAGCRARMNVPWLRRLSDDTF